MAITRKLLGTCAFPSRYDEAIWPRLVLRADDDDDDPGGGGDDKDLKAKIAAAVKEATTGLKTKNEELLGTNKKLAEEARALTEKWAGLEPEKVQALLKAAESDEETKLLAEGKVGEVVALRTEKAMKAKDAEIEALTKKNAELEAEVAKRDASLNTLVLDSAIRAAATETEVLGSAVEDALTRGRRVFQVDGDGKPVAKNSEGTVILGADAKTPMTPTEWLTEMKERAPHWWATSTGGGAAGAEAGRTSKINPFLPTTKNVTEQMRLKKHQPKEYDRLKAEASAAAA